VERVSADGEAVGNIATAYKTVRGTVGGDLDDPALKCIASAHPDTHQVAVAGVWIAGFWIGLDHGPIAMKDEHVNWKGRIRDAYNPRSNDGRHFILDWSRPASRRDQTQDRGGYND
jgi:hypothetical protein